MPGGTYHQKCMVGWRPIGFFVDWHFGNILDKKMQRDMTHAELGEVSLHGNRENCSWAQDLPYGIRGGSYKD